MPDATDRVLLARSVGGAELVRYRASGDYCIEYPRGRMIPMEDLTFRRAVIRAANWAADGGDVIAGAAGASRFSKALAQEVADREAE